MNLTGGNKKLTYVLVLAVLIIITVAFLAGRNYPSSAYIDKIVKERVGQINAAESKKMKELELRVRVLHQELMQSKLKYQRLMAKIEAVAQKEDEIKPPTSNDEIKKRLRNLGYNIPN